ncbi:MAG: hypothetical protein ACI9LN_004227 [Saprospiraceae bacterium]|jgi:hypothetical protein
MSKKTLLIPDEINQKKLTDQIQLLQQELEEIEKETHAFRTLLGAHVSDLIVEEQELFVLYKQIKKAKKAKRLAQKKRGKNYKEPKGLQIIAKQKKRVIPAGEQKERKRLYREAMLQVHPDKFSMSEKETDIATEVTSRLIEIYKTRSLETLKAYHAHIFKGNTRIVLNDAAAKIKVFAKDNYLQQEKERIEKAIDLAKNEELYKVITEYKNPLTFVEELKAYYEGRIVLLKKRTRKGL